MTALLAAQQGIDAASDFIRANPKLVAAVQSGAKRAAQGISGLIKGRANRRRQRRARARQGDVYLWQSSGQPERAMRVPTARKRRERTRLSRVRRRQGRRAYDELAPNEYVDQSGVIRRIGDPQYVRRMDDVMNWGTYSGGKSYVPRRGDDVTLVPATQNNPDYAWLPSDVRPRDDQAIEQVMADYPVVGPVLNSYAPPQSASMALSQPPTTMVAAAMSSSLTQTYAGKLKNYNVMHSEYISDVYGSTDFAISAQPVNVGYSQLFPWLSSIAVNFQCYRFVSLRFYIKTQTGATTPGSVMMVFLTDPTQAVPLDKTAMMQFDGATRSAPWNDSCLVLSERDMNRLEKYFIASGPAIETADQRLQDMGIICVATQGQDNPQPVGELWCDYSVELITPITGIHVQSQYLKVTGPNNEPLTTATLVSNVVSLGQILLPQYNTYSPFGAPAPVFSVGSAGTYLVQVLCNYTPYANVDAFVSSDTSPYARVDIHGGDSQDCTLSSQTPLALSVFVNLDGVAMFYSITAVYHLSLKFGQLLTFVNNFADVIGEAQNYMAIYIVAEEESVGSLFFPPIVS